MGQDVPDHPNLLYSYDLYRENAPAGAHVTNKNGRFIDGKGWETSTKVAQLVIELDERIPFEGTIEFDVLNLDPPNQVTDDVVLWSLYSRPEASFDAVDTSLASYVLFKTDRHRLDGNQAAFNFFTASYRGSQTRTKGKSVAKRVWNPAHKYHFKIVFNTVNLWLFIDGDLIEKHPFYGQIEKFKYILFGKDNTYPLAAAGPIFSNLEIRGPDIALPFTDITRETNTIGYSDVGYGHGVSFADVDGDGLVDLFSSNAVRALVVPDKLYINNGDGTFTDESEQRGVQDLGVTHAILAADFDNDGDPDAFHSNMPIDAGSPLGRNAIYRNDGNGYFTDMTESAGIVDENNASRGAVALDIENDGDFDIYVANWGEANELYVNQGNWTFTREDRGTKGVDVDPAVFGQQGVSAVDFDNDGDTDIYVCRRQEADLPAPNWLFVNDGHGNFTEEAAARGVDFGGRSNGASFADIDNDGDLDLIVVNNFTVAEQLDYLRVAINNGDGTFQDRSSDYNIKLTGFNAVFADIDNDADLDMYLIKNDVNDGAARPEIYLNDGTGQFSLVGYSEARVPTKDPRGVGVADIDLDGDVDFYLAAKFSRNFMVRNDIVNDNNYLRILPVGPNGDYGGFGTKITIYEPGHLGDPGRIIGYQHAQSTYGYLCQNEPTLHFGLARFDACDVRLEFANGIVRNLVGVAANQTLTVPAVVPKPTRIESLQLSAQEGFAGKQLPEPVRVRVVDDSNGPFPNHPVRFQVTSDGFLNDHQSQVDVLTDNVGIASVYWTLGQKAGQVNRLLVNSSEEGSPLENSPIEFTVLAVPGLDTLLALHSGNNQEGFTDTELGQPLVVFVSDSLGNPHANVGVRFSAEPGNGLVNGQSSATVQTDEQGLATVTWRLGSITDRSQAVTAALASDPQTVVTFYAENNHGTPSALQYVGGDSSKGIINQKLSSPLMVRIVNEKAIPLANYPVIFESTDGGTNFSGSPQTQILTNEEGIASIQPDIGGQPGNFLVIAHAQAPDGSELTGSPFQFVVKARRSLANSLTILSPDTLTGQANNMATEPVKVLVRDDQGRPVSGAIVRFERTAGGGGFGPDRLGTLTVLTGQNGVAAASFYFDNAIGEENMIRVSSEDGLDELEGSPATVYAVAKFGQPSAQMSTIDVPVESIADGEPVPVTVLLKDSQMNPVAGERVLVNAVGEQVLIEQSENKSDGNGAVTAYLASTKAGVVQVSAILADDGTRIEQTASIHFIAGPARILEIVSGNGQTGLVNSMLAEPLTVSVFDKHRNKKNNEPVEFQVVSGGGAALPGDPVYTDANGRAAVRWKLGPLAGLQTMSVSINGGDVSLLFQASAQASGELYLTKVRGDNQFAEPMTIFGDSLVVRVTDGQGNPVSGVVVTFSVLSGHVNLESFQAESNLNGEAGVRLQAGADYGTAVVRAGIGAQNEVYFNCTVAESAPAKIVVTQTTSLQSRVGKDVPVSLEVLNGEEQPVAGVDVRFETDSDALIFLAGQVVRSDSVGVASNIVRIGPRVGNYTFYAFPSGMANQKITFVVDARAGLPKALSIMDGYDQKGFPGALLEKPLLLRVTDQFDNPVPDIDVQFEVESGGGVIIEPSLIKSNADGLVSARWRLGQSGLQMVSARCDSFPDVRIAMTASLLRNGAPLLTIPGDTTIVEQQQLTFAVKAHDEDGSISSVAVEGLPAGAQFDAAGQIFNWTPGLDQAGLYKVTFEATDNLGATGSSAMTITVLNKNRPPAIMSFNPQENDIFAQPFQSLRFNVQAIDLDNDPLTTRWLLNDTEIEQGRQASFIVSPELPPLSKIRVLVSDNQDTTSRMWFIHIINTAVDLSSFAAEANGGEVLVKWQAEADGGTLGFNLYRSFREKGEYARVNSELIPVSKDGSYRYLDREGIQSGLVFYKLEEVATQGQGYMSEPVQVTVKLPQETRLFQNYPNPFNPETNIKYQLANNERVRLAVYNINGQLVKTLYEGFASAGYFGVTWNGTDQSGINVSSGIYYCVLTGRNLRQSIKLLYLR